MMAQPFLPGLVRASRRHKDERLCYELKGLLAQQWKSVQARAMCDGAADSLGRNSLVPPGHHHRKQNSSANQKQHRGIAGKR